MQKAFQACDISALVIPYVQISKNIVIKQTFFDLLLIGDTIHLRLGVFTIPLPLMDSTGNKILTVLIFYGVG